MRIKPLFAEKVFFFISNFFILKKRTLNSLRVIIYHSIPKEYKSKFEEQIKFFVDNFKIIKPQELDLFFENHFKNDICLLLTFDDGLKSQLINAIEILEKYNIKAIFFIPTKIVWLRSKDEMELFSIKNIHYGNDKIAFEREFMNINDLKEIFKLGHKIGSHTINHRKLNNLDKEEIWTELAKSKETLEEITNNKVRYFAYPKGDKTAISYESFKISKIIYDYSFIAIRGFNYPKTNKHLILRDPIHPYYPLNYIKKVLYGAFDFYYKRKLPGF